MLVLQKWGGTECCHEGKLRKTWKCSVEQCYYKTGDRMPEMDVARMSNVFFLNIFILLRSGEEHHMGIKSIWACCVYTVNLFLEFV